MRFSADQVVVAPGNKPLLILPMMAILEAGDEVLYPDPGFPTYEAAIRMVGAKPVPIPLLEENGFDLDLEAFDALVNPRTRMIILNSPGNPTGGVFSSETLLHISRAVRRYNCWILSDEIYSRLVYDIQFNSIVSLTGMAERTILIDGFSKTYSMTGWRLGFGIMPSDLARKIGLLLTHTVGCTATFTQDAGLEAITGPQSPVDQMVCDFRSRREVMLSGLNEIPGVRCTTPQGAFYAFPNISALNKSSQYLADLLLEEVGVAVLPGTAFGARGEGYLRLSYANSLENIQQAVERIHQSFVKLR